MRSGTTIEVLCNLCGDDDWELWLPATSNGIEKLQVDAFRCTSPQYGLHPQIVKCRRCGFVYANPRWSGESLVQAYEAVEDVTYVAERAGRELTFRKNLNALQKRIGAASGRSLLDVGAYIGVFVDVARQQGWQAMGVEPSIWAAGVAQAQGLNVICGTQDAPELKGHQFDVITMWDVIEHVDDPAAEMSKAFHLLKPGGWLVVHTMNVNSLAARLLKHRWPWYMDMHVHYFSKETMQQMLQKSGYNIYWIGTQGRYLTLNYLVSRISAWHPGLGRAAAFVLNLAPLGKIAVPVNFGDLFTVYAQKPG